MKINISFEILQASKRKEIYDARDELEYLLNKYSNSYEIEGLQEINIIFRVFPAISYANNPLRFKNTHSYSLKKQSYLTTYNIISEEISNLNFNSTFNFILDIIINRIFNEKKISKKIEYLTKLKQNLETLYK